jgi:hypothetical protein
MGLAVSNPPKITVVRSIHLFSFMRTVVGKCQGKETNLTVQMLFEFWFKRKFQQKSVHTPPTPISFNFPLFASWVNFQISRTWQTCSKTAKWQKNSRKLSKQNQFGTLKWSRARSLWLVLTVGTDEVGYNKLKIKILNWRGCVKNMYSSSDVRRKET